MTHFVFSDVNINFIWYTYDSFLAILSEVAKNSRPTTIPKTYVDNFKNITKKANWRMSKDPVYALLVFIC